MAVETQYRYNGSIHFECKLRIDERFSWETKREGLSQSTQDGSVSGGSA